MASRHAVRLLSRGMRPTKGLRKGSQLIPTQPPSLLANPAFSIRHCHRGFASAAIPKSASNSVSEESNQSHVIKGGPDFESLASSGSVNSEGCLPTSGGVDVALDRNGEHFIEAVAGSTLAVADASTSWSDMLLIPTTSFISSLHDATALPWWITIALATFSVRTMLLPMSVYTMRSASKTAAIQNDLKEMRNKILAAMKSGNRPLAEKMQIEQRDFMKAAGVSPVRALACQLIQFPVFVSFFVAIRRMSAADPTFSTGGVAWFVDLSSKDPTYGLPILAGLSLLAMTELGGDTGAKMTPTMRSAMRFLAFSSVPMTCWMPSAVFCYWIPSNMFSVCLGGAMRSTVLQSRLGLAVDPASIAGSKAARRAAIETGLSQRSILRGSRAAATYARGSNITNQQSTSKSAGGKPALSRTRPKPVRSPRLP